ncbi:MAG: hypothetical protein JWQ35_779 [Bacteriovoracaceae bacterium]|nr:hypothetical protein [Bacteriovoracaceae bacterium]
MKKKSGFSDLPNYFSGHCEKCGEIYQASSKADDLEGITFPCKKIRCTGRVTLSFAQERILPKESSDKSKPNRVC